VGSVWLFRPKEPLCFGLQWSNDGEKLNSAATNRIASYFKEKIDEERVYFYCGTLFVVVSLGRSHRRRMQVAVLGPQRAGRDATL